MTITHLGLTKYEHQIYKTLAQYNTLNAKQLAQHSSVPQTAVYPTVKSLTEKNLIITFQGDPATYQLIDPKTAIPNLLAQQKKELETSAQHYIQTINSIQKQPQLEEEKQVLKLSKGKDISLEVYKQFFKTTKSSLYIMGWRLHKFGNVSYLINECKKLINKGVDIRVIVTGKNTNKKWELVKQMLHVGIKVRYYCIDNFSIVISDSTECKITIKSLNDPERYNMHILEKDLTKAMISYYKTTWKKAESVHQFID